jgi:outer membrane protein assembly factor BamB
MNIPIRNLLALFALCAACSLSQLQAEQTGPPRRVLGADDSTRKLAIIAPDGSVEWETKVGAIHDAWMLPNGNILYQQGWTKIIEVTPEKQTVWEYDSARMNGNEGKRVEVHAFQRLADGSTMIAESGPARIIEVDKAGRILREVKLKVNKPNAHSDTRLVRKIANGNYLVAHEADGFVREYDATGKVVWEYEVPLFGKPRKGGHGPEAFGNSLYSAIRLDNGNTLIGGGNGHCVLEVTPQKEIVWKLEQNDLPGITLAWVTRVERLANGHTRFGNCHAGPENPQFIEVTKDKKVVWTFKDFKNFGNSLPVQAVLEAKK